MRKFFNHSHVPQKYYNIVAKYRFRVFEENNLPLSQYREIKAEGIKRNDNFVDCKDVALLSLVRSHITIVFLLLL